MKAYCMCCRIRASGLKEAMTFFNFMAEKHPKAYEKYVNEFHKSQEAIKLYPIYLQKLRKT